VEACPYGSRFIDQRTRKVDKCDFCRSRIERGSAPVCVSTCTAHAKYFGDLEDRDSDVFRMVFLEGARRMETATVAVGPNVFYVGRPEHLDLILASFPPHAPRLLAAGEAWRKLLRPLVVAAVGAAFLGQAVAFATQLHEGEDDYGE
jgi:tetrathionate reductase subunit B